MTPPGVTVMAVCRHSPLHEPETRSHTRGAPEELPRLQDIVQQQKGNSPGSPPTSSAGGSSPASAWASRRRAPGRTGRRCAAHGQGARRRRERRVQPGRRASSRKCGSCSCWLSEWGQDRVGKRKRPQLMAASYVRRPGPDCGVSTRRYPSPPRFDLSASKSDLPGRGFESCWRPRWAACRAGFLDLPSLARLTRG